MNDVGTRLDVHRPVAWIPGARHQAEAMAIVGGRDLNSLAACHLAEDEAVAHDVAVADNPSFAILVDVDLEGAMTGCVVVDIDRT